MENGNGGRVCAAADVIRFGIFEIDPRSGELRKSGLRLKLPDQPVQVLLLLLENAGHVVTRDQLRERLWSADTFVDFDKGVNRAINKIREVLGDSAESPRFVETLPRHGYRFIAPVERIGKNGDHGENTPPATVILHAEAPGTQPKPSRTAASASSSWNSGLPWLLAAALAVISISLAVAWRQSVKQQPRRLIRLGLQLGVSVPNNSRDATAILSPDGSRLVFSGWGPDGKFRLYSRQLDQPEAVPLAGSEGANHGFFSPDGEWVGFFTGGKLKKIPVQGGTAVDLCDVSPFHVRGGSWGDDGNIVAALSAGGGLSRLPSTGGAPRAITELDHKRNEVTQRWPQVLPGARSILYTAHNAGGNYDDASIEAQSLATGKRTILHRGGYYGRYLPSGHLVFVRERTLFAAPMDLARLQLTGPPVPVLLDVVGDPDIGSLEFGFSQTGTAVCLTGLWAPRKRSLVWLDCAGKTQLLPATPGPYGDLRLSPDGRRLALSVRHGIGQWHIWIYDLQQDMMTRLTFSGINLTPEWHPDGRHLVFVSDRHRGMPCLYWMRADGAGEALRLTENKYIQWPYSFSPDGKWLAYVEPDPETRSDIWILPMEGNDPDRPKPGKPQPFLNTAFAEESPAFSPDGSWLAYQSDESGRMEIYVRPFPGPGGKWQVSSSGGKLPVWSRNRKELFYLSEDNQIMVAAYKTTRGAFVAGIARLWSEQRIPVAQNTIRNFDPAPSGDRFVALAESENPPDASSATQLTIFLNFFDEIRRLTR